uniref:Uncharacterized protein n=1 Tax=Tanacetum cinerariifolium TaxID=118510 RepID=A0A6L2LP13_TANCI|nr:hypothetical protein [Tanacetum cinerariifolium]
MSSLDFLAKLAHLKVLHKWTDTSFDETMEFLLKAFPTGAKLPKSYYEAKKSMNKVGLGYESIDACINDFRLFWGKDNKDEGICPTCKASRWKNKDTTRNKVPNKVFHYFPLIPRLKHMYGSLHTAKHMTWHAIGKCIKDGKIGHPVDGKAWKEFNKNNPEFAKEHRNVRLGLAADGFNPFENSSQSYSKGMDVYLQPLVKELKTLWKKPGDKTLDVATNTEFSMRAILLRTISDFPARSSLSARPEGCIAKGYIAEEALTFYSHYLWNVPTRFNHLDRNVDGSPPTSELEVFQSACTPKSAGVRKKLDHEVKKKLVWYVLDNSPEINKYKTEYRLAMSDNDLPIKFSQWFRDKDKDVIMDEDVVYDSNSSDVALTANLNDLEYIRLSGAGPSMKHGGDNGPPNDDRPWEPPAIHKNAKGRKKGSDATLIKQFEVVPFYYESWDALPDKYKGTLWPAIHTHLSSPNAKQIEKGMEAQFKGQYKNRKNKFKDDMFVSRVGYEQLNKANRGKLPQCSTQGSKTYASSRHEEWEANGVFPDLIEHYKKTRQKKGKWNKMLKLRASQEGLAEKMTDDEIMDKVLGSSLAFKPGRGRKLPRSASSSSVCSYPAPLQSASQAALRTFVEAHNEQMK